MTYTANNGRLRDRFEHAPAHRGLSFSRNPDGSYADRMVASLWQMALNVEQDRQADRRAKIAAVLKMAAAVTVGVFAGWQAMAMVLPL